MPNLKLEPCPIIKSCVIERGTAASGCSLRFLAEKGKSGLLGYNVLLAPG